MITTYLQYKTTRARLKLFETHLGEHEEFDEIVIQHFKKSMQTH